MVREAFREKKAREEKPGRDRFEPPMWVNQNALARKKNKSICTHPIYSFSSNGSKYRQLSKALPAKN